MYSSNDIKSKVLRDIVQGNAIPCGSGYFQTCDGSEFLGAASDAALNEAALIESDDAWPMWIREECATVLRYSGAVRIVRGAK